MNNVKLFQFIFILAISFYSKLSFAMNNDQITSFKDLPEECMHLILNHCEVEDISQVSLVNHSFNHISNSVISSPLFLDKIIKDLNKIETFSAEKLKFLLKIKTLLKERLLKKIRDQDLKALSNIIKNKENLNVNYARLAAFKMKALLYLMNIKEFSANLASDSTFSIVSKIILISNWNTSSDSFSDMNSGDFKRNFASPERMSDAQNASNESSMIVAQKASINSAWSDELDNLLNNELQDSTWLTGKTALRFLKSTVEEDRNIKKIRNFLLKLKPKTLSSLSKSAHDFTEIMVLYFFLEDQSHFFTTGFKNIYEKLVEQNLLLPSNRIDDIILEHLIDTKISENDWIIEFNQFLNALDQVFNPKNSIKE